MRLDLLAALNREVAARRACVMATFLDDDAQQLFLADEAPQDTLDALALEALRGGRSRLVTIDGREIFLTVATSAPRFVLIGAVHVAQALAPMARLAGLDVTIVDPREACASVERFRNVSLVNQWPQDALAQTPLDAYCAVVLLTHDPKIEDPALHAALDAKCCYVGALGSRRTHQARLQRLAAAGRGAGASRICAPIGLDIGAANSAEIAVAILAEVIGVLRGRSVPQ